MNFAANLRAIRKLRKLTQARLAELCDWENATRVTNYESQSKDPRNRRKPDVNEALLLARKLQVPIDLLFSETPPESLEPSSPSARLDASILRNANLLLVADFARHGQIFEPDLDRDAELISLVYAWAADRSDDAAFGAMRTALDERLGVRGDGEGRDAKAPGRSRRGQGR